MPRVKRYRHPDVITRVNQQMEFVRTHREKVPNLIKSVVHQLHCSPSSVYNVINGMQFSPQIAEALYTVTTQALGTAAVVGEQTSATGQAAANTHDRKILEQLIATQDAEQDLRARHAAFLVALHEYENAHVLAEVAKATLRTLYQVTGPKLSPESVTMIAEALASDIATFAIPEESLVEIPTRSRDEIIVSALSSPEPNGQKVYVNDIEALQAPKPQYEPLPIAPPEPGNTQEDYERWQAERKAHASEPKPLRSRVTREAMEEQLAAARAAIAAEEGG